MLKQVFILLSGSATAQLLLMLSYIFLARWYGPGIMGEFRNYTAISLSLAVIMMGGYEMALMLNKTDERLATHMKLCWRIWMATSVALIVLFFTLGQLLVEWLQAPHLAFWVYVLPFSIILESAINLMQQFLTKKQHYGQLSKAYLLYGVVFGALSLSGSLGVKSVHWIFGGMVLAQMAKALWVFRAYWKLKPAIAGTDFNSIQKQAHRFRDYPIFHLGSSAANQASREMVPPVLSSLFGPSLSGWFSMANVILLLPMRFIAQAFPQVFYQRIAQAKSQGARAVRKETLQAMGLLVVLNALPTACLAIIGPSLFAWLLGPEWANAGLYIKWLAAFALLSSVTSPLMGLVNVHFQLKAFFLYNMVLLLTRIGSVWLVAQLGYDANTTIAWYGILAAIGTLGLLLWVLHLGGILQRKNA